MSSLIHQIERAALPNMVVAFLLLSVPAFLAFWFAMQRGVSRRWRADRSPLDLAIHVGLLALPLVLPLAFSRWFQDPLIQKTNTVQFVVSLAMGVYLTRELLTGRLRVPRSLYLWPMLGLLFVSLLSVGWSPTGQAAMDDWINILCYVLFFLVVCVVAHRPALRDQLAASALAGASLVGLLCLLQARGFSFFDLIAVHQGDQPLTIEQSRNALATTIGHNLGTSGQSYFGLILAGYLLARCDARRVQATVIAMLIAVGGLLCLLLPLVWLGSFSADRSAGNFATEVAGYLALCAVTGGALLTWRRWPWATTATLLTMLLGLHLLVLVITQSRVYWLAFVAAAVVLLALLLWLRPWRNVLSLRRVALLASAGALLLAVLLGALSLAPGGHLPGLRERLRDFRWETIESTTQVRLNMIGLFMARERPWLGTGLSGFKYYYPEYQGRYFEENPYSRLRPAQVFTLRAHNDLLQVIIEFGVLGTALLVGFVLVHLFQLRRLCRLPPSQQVQGAILYAGVCGMALVALGYFPFHEAPAALNSVLSLGLLAAVIGPGPRAVSTGRFALRPLRHRFTVGVAIGCALLVLLNMGVRCASILQADVHVKAGGMMARTWGEVLNDPDPRRRQEAYARLDQAVVPYFEKGLNLLPYRGDLRWMYVRLLTQLFWHEMEATGNVNRDRAYQITDQAREVLRTYRFGEVYYYVGQVQAVLGFMARERGDTRADEFFEQAVNNIRRTTWIIPRNYAALHFLGNTYWEWGKKWEAVRVWRRCLNEPGFIDNRFLDAARQAERAGNMDKAEAALRALVALDPSNFQGYSRLMWLYIDHGESDLGRGRRLDPGLAKATAFANLALERRWIAASQFAVPQYLYCLGLERQTELPRRFRLLWDASQSDQDRWRLYESLFHFARVFGDYPIASDVLNDAAHDLEASTSTPHPGEVKAQINWLAGNPVTAYVTYQDNQERSEEPRYHRAAAQSILTTLALPLSLSLSQ